MDQEMQDKLQRFLDLVPKLQRHLLCGRPHYRQAQRLLDQLVPVVQHLHRFPSTDLKVPGVYWIFKNGRPKRADREEVRWVRATWDGIFLLDVPSRKLRVKSGDKKENLELGKNPLHRGVERVLEQGMKSPGISFGHLTWQPGGANEALANSPDALTRYVHVIRKAIKDIGPPFTYVRTVSVDRSRSNSESGYVFDDRWYYLVVPTRWSDRK